jgi:pimeloyl-ACP methyl ester carboxylesterase
MLGPGGRSDELMVADYLRADVETSAELLVALSRGTVVAPLGQMIHLAACTVLRGEHDPLCRRSVAIELADRVGAAYEEIPDAGHMPQLEQPGRLADALTRIAR